MKMMSSFSSIEGIGFANPSSTVREVINSLARYGEMRGRPSIGITVGSIPATASSHYKLPEGLYVSEVSKGSDAEIEGKSLYSYREGPYRRDIDAIAEDIVRTFELVKGGKERKWLRKSSASARF